MEADKEPDPSKSVHANWIISDKLALVIVPDPVNPAAIALPIAALPVNVPTPLVVLVELSNAPLSPKI
jgi:hypothetical protein